MKIAIFDTHKFEKPVFEKQNEDFGHQLTFFDTRLTHQTANLALGFSCVCAFVNDVLSRDVLEILSSNGTRLIALRSAGFNHIDLKAAKEFNLKVVRVPEYSPYAVAEYALALLLTLNRKIHKAYNRVREGNFSLDGLVGFDLHGKKAGLIGAGKIGRVMAKILLGFGCEVLVYDRERDLNLENQGVCYVELENLLRECDIISLHVPLTPDTFHMVNQKAFEITKPGMILINTGRGALVDTQALIAALKTGRVGGAALDVYEEEEGVFFSDLSGQILQDDVLARLLIFPNVVLTSHQAFLTSEALTSIARTTLENVMQVQKTGASSNEVHYDRLGK